MIKLQSRSDFEKYKSDINELLNGELRDKFIDHFNFFHIRRQNGFDIYSDNFNLIKLSARVHIWESKHIMALSDEEIRKLNPYHYTDSKIAAWREQLRRPDGVYVNITLYSFGYQLQENSKSHSYQEFELLLSSIQEK